MAKAKKASRRYSRARSYKRYYRRRRYRRKYPRRSGRRFPKGTEVKSKSKAWSSTLLPEASEGNTITFPPGCCFIVGSDGTGSYELGFPQGVNNGERIGTKIEPFKLRISGSISLMASVNNNLSMPNFWQVRVLVYQVKGANTSVPPNNEAYHQLAMVSATDNGWVSPKQLAKLLMSYNWDGNVQNDLTRFTSDHWLKNNLLGKIPLRRGIGGLCRILYKKTFWINTQKNPVKQFRFVTKAPKRFVYPELTDRGDQNNFSNVPNNAVYILWMFQPGSFTIDSVPRLNINYNVDLFYTDK